MIISEEKSLEEYLGKIIEEKKLAREIYTRHVDEETGDDPLFFYSLDCVIIDYEHKRCLDMCKLFKNNSRAAIAVYPVDPKEETDYPLLVGRLENENPAMKGLIDYYIPISFTPESIEKLASTLKWRKFFRVPFFRKWTGK